MFFIESTLGESQFDRAIIHLGITNLLNTTGTEGLLQNILKIAARCKTHIICKIFVSSVLHTGKVSSDMVAKLNLDIDNIVKSNSFHFVDNNNVSINYILAQMWITFVTLVTLFFDVNILLQKYTYHPGIHLN